MTLLKIMLHEWNLSGMVTQIYKCLWVDKLNQIPWKERRRERRKKGGKKGRKEEKREGKYYLYNTIKSND